MREIFATIKINETSSPLSLSFLSFAKQGKTADGQKRISTDTVLFPPPRQGLQQSILLLSFINELFSGWTRIFLITRSPRARRPSIDPDEDGSLLFLTAVAELGYYFTPRYSSSVGVFLKFFSSSRSHARRTIESPS